MLILQRICLIKIFASKTFMGEKTSIGKKVHYSFVSYGGAIALLKLYQEKPNGTKA